MWILSNFQQYSKKITGVYIYYWGLCFRQVSKNPGSKCYSLDMSNVYRLKKPL